MYLNQMDFVGNKQKKTSKKLTKISKIFAVLATTICLQTVASAETYQIVYHTVEKGQSLSSLAEKFNVSVNKIKKLNKLDGEMIKIGESLLIPTNSSAESDVAVNSPKKEAKKESKPVPAGTETNYQVKKGDSLFEIARKNGVDIPSLLKINNISRSYKLLEGDVLVLPAGSKKKSKAKVAKKDKVTSPATKLAKTKKAKKSATNVKSKKSTSSKYSNYQVQVNENIAVIASKFNTTEAELIRINNIKNRDYIQLGQQLKVPKKKVVVKTKKAVKANKKRIYIVQPDDQLAKIANKHKVTLAALMKENNIDATTVNDISIGDSLKIPARK